MSQSKKLKLYDQTPPLLAEIFPVEHLRQRPAWLAENEAWVGLGRPSSEHSGWAAPDTLGTGLAQGLDSSALILCAQLVWGTAPSDVTVSHAVLRFDCSK